ncbi:ABC transporter permease [Bacillus sp. 03113]|uniref:ABC transporter permease n=1 Tax=Bacillus sp. 03113 TaxID=2578211 RepID=UPI001141FA55|nr:ABC transporter permease [Bacillus sp. 03113]
MEALNKFGVPFLSYKAIYPIQSIRSFILFRLLDPLIHYLFFAALVSAIAGTEYLKYIVLGNIVYYTGRTMLFHFMYLLQMERRFGTLELNIAAPLSTFRIIFQKGFIPLVDGLFVFIYGLLIGQVLFHLTFPVDQAFSILLLLIVTLFSMISFSMMIACTSLLFSNVNLFSNIMMALLQVFCGVNFSVQLFPAWIQKFVSFLPLTHSIEAIRSIFHLESSSIYPLLLKEFLIGILYLCIAAILINVMEKLARKYASFFKV